MTRSLLILGTAGILSITTTRDVIYLVKGTPEVMVSLIIVLILCRMALSKVMSSTVLSLLSETKKDL